MQGGGGRKGRKNWENCNSIINKIYFKKVLTNPKIFYSTFAQYFFKDFIYLFLDREEGKEKGKERNISMWLPLSHSVLGTWPIPRHDP